MTQRLDADTATNIVLNSVGTLKDPLTALSARTNFGRPDFKRLFSAMKDGVLDGSYMGDELARKGKAEVGVSAPLLFI